MHRHLLAGRTHLRLSGSDGSYLAGDVSCRESRHRLDNLFYACCSGHFYVPCGPLAGALRHQENDHSRHHSHRLQLCCRCLCNFDLYGLRLGFSQWACLQLRLHSHPDAGAVVVPGEEGACCWHRQHGLWTGCRHYGTCFWKDAGNSWLPAHEPDSCPSHIDRWSGRRVFYQGTGRGGDSFLCRRPHLEEAGRHQEARKISDSARESTHAKLLVSLDHLDTGRSGRRLHDGSLHRLRTVPGLSTGVCHSHPDRLQPDQWHRPPGERILLG